MGRSELDTCFLEVKLCCLIQLGNVRIAVINCRSRLLNEVNYDKGRAFPLVEEKSLKDARMREALAAKSLSRGKIQQRCCQGLIASSESQRQTVLSLMLATNPVRLTSAATSEVLIRGRGIPREAGNSHAKAFTWMTRSGGKRSVDRGAAARRAPEGAAQRISSAICRRSPDACPDGPRSRRFQILRLQAGPP